LNYSRISGVLWRSLSGSVACNPVEGGLPPLSNVNVEGGG